MGLKRNNELKGIEKVAVFLITLGPEVSSQMLKRFSDNEIERITMEIANTTAVSGEKVDTVLDEFLLLSEARQYMVDGGMNYAKDILERTLGTQKAGTIIKKLKDSSQIKPFNFVRDVDPKQLSNIVKQEHPQTIALILSYLQPEQSAIVLSELDLDVQPDIARRMALMERTSPEVLKEVEKVLESRLSSVMFQDFTAAGGIPSLVNILNRVDRSTEKHILEELEKHDEELAEEIRMRMFVFEDIVTLEDSAIQRVLREVDTKDLALALKGVDSDVSERILMNVSTRAAEMIREDIEYMGPVKLKDVEEAQQRTVAVIRQLDEAGEIALVRGGEGAMIA
ncbi:MAG: flagellar motor switch protein FliG [Firmicutes bacterium]|nr:flagellar motor switch protein FliG [Bacillota bacterium]